MTYYVVSIKNADDKMFSVGVTATSMANAIVAAKQSVGIATDSSTDSKVQSYQVVGSVDAQGV